MLVSIFGCCGGARGLIIETDLLEEFGVGGAVSAVWAFLIVGWPAFLNVTEGPVTPLEFKLLPEDAFKLALEAPFGPALRLTGGAADPAVGFEFTAELDLGAWLELDLKVLVVRVFEDDEEETEESAAEADVEADVEAAVEPAVDFESLRSPFLAAVGGVEGSVVLEVG